MVSFFRWPVFLKDAKVLIALDIFFFYCLIVYFLQNYDIEIRKKKKEDIKIVPEKEKKKKPKFME